ncbi:MAG: hypothetical protein IT376_12545 [Polyangiaceae bacterium]|nr:hypothetical protein [Polyangiaceae bacterium]
MQSRLSFAAAALVTLSSLAASAAPLIIDGTNPASTSCPGGTVQSGGRRCVYGGRHSFDYVDIRNGGELQVATFDGTNPAATGNLELVATGLDPTGAFSIRVDVSSRIDAKAVGYQGKLCDDGPGPNGTAGGRGGCSVKDSGGGGAHFGRGGKGTKDCFVFGSATTCQFPQEFEESCGSLNSNGTSCTYQGPGGLHDCGPTQTCANCNDGPPVFGVAFQHSIYEPQFGAAGGDKGCGDGFDGALRAGDGGGRVVLVAATATQTGVLRVDGRIIADGARGCSSGNDSAGGGAGGTILLVGDQVTITDTARVTAHGGRGGDAQPKCLPCTGDGDCQSGQTCQTLTEPASGATYRLCGPCNCTPCTSNADCRYPGHTCRNLGGALGNVCATAGGACTPYDVGDDETECAGTQNSGTCDDCGGGGGGGIVTVQSRTKSIDPRAIFDVRGGYGGVCPICAGEAGGGAGELQVDGAFVGEICDGYDNDFDGSVDEDLPDLACPGGATPSCVGGVPADCTYDPATCEVPATDARPRFALVLDSSGSMLNDLQGDPTFGDGSLDFPGLDTNADTGASAGNDSRLYIAKRAVAKVLAAFPENGYALARYYQDAGIARSCQTANWFECAQSCCSYDDPTDNVAPAYPGHYPGNQCVLSDIYPGAGYNHAGATANIQIGWATPSADCINYAGSCGPPRRGAQFLVGFDAPIGRYLSWLDGAETSFVGTTVEGDHCSGGDCELRGTGPTPLAGSLQAAESFLRPVVTCDGARDCRAYSVILLTDGAESCQGDPVAAATALRTAVPGKDILTYVIGFSVTAGERAQLNAIATAGGTNAGTFTGQPDAAFFADDENGLANAIATIIANSQVFETCNDADDDCDSLVDEDFPDKGLACDDGQLGACRGTGTIVCSAGGTGTECVIDHPGASPGTEVCNGLDDDCDGLVDEGLSCSGCVPAPEICNGVDDDCDSLVDSADPELETNEPTVGQSCGTLTPPNDQPPCQLGTNACINGTIRCVGYRGPLAEICNGRDDDCDGVADTFEACPGANRCVEGRCLEPCRSGEFPCAPGFDCTNGFCEPRGCAGVTCDPGQTCVNGLCVFTPDGGGADAGTGGAGPDGGGPDGSPGGGAGTGGAGTGGAGTGGAGTGGAGTGGGAPDGGDGGPVAPYTGDDYWGLATGGGGCGCAQPGGPAPGRYAWGALLALAALVVGRRSGATREAR